jgi:hypothetical protein
MARTDRSAAIELNKTRTLANFLIFGESSAGKSSFVEQIAKGLKGGGLDLEYVELTLIRK